MGKIMMENKRKHLEFIQKVIDRMAKNSFFLRGWTITLVVALFAFSVKDTNLIVYFPVIIFWILDGYFLSQERLFRALYDHVRKIDEEKIDFSMDTAKFRTDKRNGWLRSMLARTLLFFYLSIVVIMSFITFFSKTT